MRNSGQPLAESLRSFFEPRFGVDLSQVRVHTDTRAAEAAQAVNARAFTVGLDIAFGAGQHAPGTTQGRRLLAHELTHVVQQQRRLSPPSSQSSQSTETHNQFEDEAAHDAPTVQSSPIPIGVHEATRTNTINRSSEPESAVCYKKPGGGPPDVWTAFGRGSKRLTR
jgi:hypothetical protein